MENKISMQIRLGEIKQYYLYGIEVYNTTVDSSEQYLKPNLRDFIKYVKEFKISGFNIAIINKDKVIKIAYGK